MCSSENEMLKWYENYYTTVDRSSAYSQYCTKVFGKDFSQQGFSNMEQITAMLNLLDIKPNSSILDIGCGNGKLIEYISDITDSIGYGFDYSSAAVQSANERTIEKRSRIIYEVGSIGTKQYPPNSFDVVLVIDTIFFADNICQFLKDIFNWLKQGGRIAIFYSEFRFNENEPLNKMLPDETALAKAFINANIKYDTYDFLESHYEHMKLKKRVALEHERDFEAQGTMILFNNIVTESINDDVDFDAFKRFSTRYLYIAEKITL